MNKKNTLIYIVILGIGLLLGWFLFGGGTIENTEHKHSEEKTEIWTCSMHPQIKLQEPGDCPMCGMDLIPLDPNASNNPLVIEMTEDAIRLMNIETTVVGINTSKKGTLRISGKIISDETTTASIVSHIPGRIEKLYVAFTGEKIRKGQIIAKIYSPNLITAQKELIETAKIKKVNPKLYEAALNKLKYWKITDQQIEEILRSKKVKESFGIYAEHSGIVTNKRVSVGDHLMEGGILFDIQNLDRLWVEFDVYEADLQLVNIGDEVLFTTPSLPNEQFSAKISFIDPVINPRTRSASIRVEISNAKHQLKPEMFANGEILKEGSLNSQITVPKTAVMWTGTRSVVYVQQKNVSIPSFEFREITIGGSTEESYIITNGIAIGDEVVTKGAFVIDASAQLNNQSSMMNRLVDGAETAEETPNYKSSTPEKFTKQLNELILTYFNLKDELVASDVNTTKKFSEKLNKNLENIDMTLLKGEAHVYWMKQMQLIQKYGEKITFSDDIDKQRTNFELLSTAIINSSKAFGIETNAFVLYCPMAFENEGAFWLSKESSITNPYFGDEMLTCGTVKDSI